MEKDNGSYWRFLFYSLLYFTSNIGGKMLKTISKEEMYLICQRLISQANLSQQKVVISAGEHILARETIIVCNEMINLLDLMPQLERAVKLEGLVKELHNHLHNH